MTDIVERLRKAYESTDEWALVMDAADAIESLDSALEAAQQLAMSRGDELNAKDAEIERLRAAIQSALDKARAAERERCAKVAEDELPDDPYAPVSQFDSGKHIMAAYIAAAIRKRPIPGSPYETRISKTLLYTKGTT